MDWASSEWMQELSPAALQKVKGLEEQVEWMQKERQQRMLKIDNLEQTIQNQKLKLEEEKAENASLRRDVQKLEEHCKDYENKQARLQNEVQMRDAKISLLENQLEQLKANLGTIHQFEADTARHKVQLEIAEQKSVELELALKGQEETNIQLQEQLTVLKSQLDALSTTPDLMAFDCEKPDQEISTLRQQISEQENIISELQLKLSKQNIVEIAEDVKSEPLALESTPESQSDYFWNKFESQSSSNLRRTVRVKSDSMLLASQEGANEKVLLLERLQQASQELECLRSNSAVIKAQMEQKFKDSEKELQTEIKHQLQVIADLDSQLQETKAKLQQDITQANKELDVTRLQLDKFEKRKLELEDEIYLLTVQVKDANEILQSKENVIAELLQAKEALKTESEYLSSKNSKLEFENDTLSLKIKERDAVLTESEPLLKVDLAENAINVISENTNVIGELQDKCNDLEMKQLCLEEEIKTLQDKLSQAKDDIQDKVCTLDAMELESSVLKNENEEKSLLNSELQESNVTLSEEISNLRLENNVKSDTLSSLEKDFTLLKLTFEETLKEKSGVEVNEQQLQVQKDLLEEKIKLLEGEKEQAVIDNKAQTDVINEIEKELIDLKNELEQQTLLNSDLQESNAALNKENSNLQLENNVKSDTLSSLEKDLASLKLTFEETFKEKGDIRINEQQLQAEKDLLEEKVKLLEKEKEQAVIDNKAQTNVINAIEKELTDLKNELEQQTLAYTQLKDYESELTTQLENMVKQIDELQTLNLESQSDIKTRDDGISSLEKEIVSLKDTAEQQLLLLNQLKEENETLEHNKQSLQESVVLLKEETQLGKENIQALEFAREELHCLRRDYDEETSAKRQMEMSLYEVNNELEIVKGNLKSYEEQIELLESHLENNTALMAALEDDIRMMQATSEDQLMVLDAFETENKDLREQNIAYELEIKTLKQEIDTKSKELEFAVEELSSLKARYEEKNQENGILKQSDVERDAELKSKLETLTRFEDKLKVLESSLIEKENQISVYNEETIILKASVEQQKTLVCDSEAHNQNLNDQKESLQEEINNLKDDLLKANYEVEVKNKALDSSEIELSTLKIDLQEKIEINEQLEMQNQIFVEKNEQLLLELEQKNLSISIFQNEDDIQKASLKQEVDKQTKEVEEMNLQLNIAQKQLVELEERVQTSALDIAEKNNMIMSLQSEISTLNLSLEEQHILMSTLQTINQQTMEQKNLLEIKLESLGQEMLSMGLAIESKNDILDSIKKEISDLELHSDEKTLQMKELVDTLIEVDDRLKPVDGLLHEIEAKVQTMELELQERENAISSLREEIDAFKLSSEKHVMEKHAQEAEVFRYKMDNECLEFELQELKVKAASDIKFEQERATDMKVMFLRRNPNYSQKFSEDVEETRDIAAAIPSDDILSYYDSLAEEVVDLKMQVGEIQELKKQNDDHQLIINNLEKELQLSEENINLKDVALQEMTNSLNLQTATLEGKEEELKLMEVELNGFKVVCNDLETTLRQCQDKYQTYDQAMDNMCLNLQSTHEELIEQHALAVGLQEKLLHENYHLTKFVDDFTEIRDLAVSCLHSFGEYVPEPESEYGLSDYIKSIMKELHSVAVKLVEKQKENEKIIADRDEYSQALVNLLHVYDSTVSEKSSTEKHLQEKLISVKGFVTSLTQTLYERNICSENQEKLTFKLKDDLETCVLSIKHMMQKTMKLKKQFKKNLTHSRKIANTAQKYRMKMSVMKKCEMKLRRALRREKCDVLKMSTFFANLLKMFIEKLSGSSTWPIEHLLFYAFSCFPEVFTPNTVETFMHELQQTTSTNMESNLSLVSVQQSTLLNDQRNMSTNPKVTIIENTFHLSHEIERLMQIMKHHNNLKKMAADWKMQCDIYLPELCSRQKTISDLQKCNCELLSKMDNLLDELDGATKQKLAIEKALQESLTAENTVKEEKENLQKQLALLQNKQMEEIEVVQKNLLSKEQACFEMEKVIKELEEKLQQSNNKNKELHEEVQHVTGGLKDLQRVIAENKETYYSPAQYEELEAKAKSLQQETESLKVDHSKTSDLLQRIETAVVCMFSKYPCNEIEYSSLEDIPVVIQKLQGGFEQQKNKIAESKMALELKDKEVMDLERSTERLMNKINIENGMLIERTQENKNLQVCLEETESQLQSYCEKAKEMECELSDRKEQCEASILYTKELQEEVTSLKLANSKMGLTLEEVDRSLQKASLEKQQLKCALDTILVKHVCNYEDICTSLDNIPAVVQDLCDKIMQQKAELDVGKNAVNLKNKEIITFETSVQDLMEQMNVTTSLLAEKDQEIQQLQIKFEESENQLENYLQIVKGKELKISDWEMKFDVLSKSNEELQKQLASSDSINSMLASTNDEMEEKLKRSSHENKQLKEALDKILVCHITDYEDSCTSLADIPPAVQTLCSDLMRQGNIIKDMAANLDFKKEEIMTLEESVRELTQMIGADANHLVEKDQSIQELEIKLKESQQLLESSSKDKDQEINNWKKKYVIADKSATELQRDLNAIERNISIMESAVSKVEENMKNVEIEKQNLKDLLDKILSQHVPNYATNSASLESISMCIQTLCDAYAQKKTETDELKMAVDSKNEEVKASEIYVTELTKKLNITNDLLVEKAEEIHQLQITQQEFEMQMQKYFRDFEDKECEISECKAKFDALSNSNEAIQTELSSLKSTNEGLEENLQQFSSEKKQTEDAIWRLIHDHIAYDTSSSNDIPAAIQALCNDLGRQEGCIENLDAKIMLKEEEIMYLVRSIEELKEELNINVKLLAEKNENAQQIENKLKEHEEKLLTYCQAVEDKECEISECKAKFDALSDSNEAIQTELSSLKSTNEELEKNLQQFSSEKKQTEDAIWKLVNDHIAYDTSSPSNDIPAAIRALCNELGRQERCIENFDANDKLKEEEIMYLVRSIEELDEELNIDVKLLAEKNENAQQIEIKLKEHEEKLLTYCQAVEGKELEISDLEMKFDALNKSNEELQKQLASSDSINSMLASTNDEMEEKLKRSSHEKQQLKEALDRILVCHITDYEDSCTSLADIPSAVQTLCSDLMQQGNIIKDMTSNLDLRREEVMTLEESVRELTQMMDADANHLVEKDQSIQELEIKLKESQELLESSSKDKDQEINNWKKKYVIADKSATELQRDLNAIERNISIMESAVSKVEENMKNVEIEKQNLKDLLDKILSQHVPNYATYSASLESISMCIQTLCDVYAQNETEIDELKEAVDSKNEEVKASEIYVMELTKKLDITNNLLVEKAEEIHQLQIKQQEFETQIQKYFRDFEGKECEIADWKVKYDETKQTVDEFQSQLASLESENTKLVSTVEEVNEKLQMATLDRKQLKDSLDKIVAECLTSDESNSMALEDISAVSQKLCHEFLQQKNAIDEMKLTINLKHDEIMALEKSTRETMERINTDANLLAEKSEEIEQLRNKLEESDNQLQSYCKDFSIKENEISELKLKFNTSTTSIEELQKQLTTLESANAMLNSTIDEVEENLQTVYLEKQQLTDLLSKILTEHDANCKDACTSFESIPIAIQKLCDEFIQKESEVNELKLTVELKNEDLVSIGKINEKLKEDIDTNTAISSEMMQEIKQLQTKLAESENRLQTYCTDVINKDHEISHCKLQYEELSNSIEMLNKKLKAAELENAMLNKTIDEIEENLQRVYLEKNQLQDALDKVLEQHVPDYKNAALPLENIPIVIEKLYVEITQHKHEIRESKLILDAKNEEILAFEVSTKEHLKKLNDKTDILAKKTQEVEQLQIKQKDLDNQIQNYYVDIKSKEREISDWEINCDAYKTTINELQKELYNLKSTNVRLSKTIDELKEKLQNVSQEEQQIRNKLDTVMAEYVSSSAVLQQEDSRLKSELGGNKQLIGTVEGTVLSSSDIIHETKDQIVMLVQRYQEIIKKLKSENQDKSNFIMKQELKSKETGDMLENYELSLKELQNLNSEISQRCKESDKEIFNLQQERTQLLQQVKNLTENELNVGKLNTENEALQQAVLNWRIKFDDHVSSCILANKLPKDNFASSSTETEVKDQEQLSLQISEVTVETYKKDKAALESELSVLRSAFDEAKQTEQALRTTIAELESDLLSNQQQLNNQLSLMQKKSDDMENMNMDINTLKRENEELQSTKDNLQEKMKKLDTEFIQCKSDCRTTSNNLEMLKLEHTPLLSENESLRSIVSELKMRVKDLKVRAEINEEICISKNEQLEKQDESIKDAETDKKSPVADIESTSGVLLKEFFENATKILNLIVIWRSGQIPVTVQSNEKTDIETSEVSFKPDESQLQFSSALQSLSSLNEKLANMIAEMYPESQLHDTNLGLCNETRGIDQDVLVILKEFKDCLSTLCISLQTFKNSSEEIIKQLEQEKQNLQSNAMAHLNNSPKVTELEDQVKKLTAERQSLDGKMGLLKNNCYRLEKCLLSLQKQHAELQEKTQKQEDSPASHEKESNELEEKVKELSEELQEVSGKLEKSQAELLGVYSSQVETQKKFDASRRQCQSLKAHLQLLQNKLQEKMDSSNMAKVKATPLKEGVPDASSLNQEHISNLCRTTGKENCSPPDN